MNKPLAYRLRPTKLTEVIGQHKLVGENQIIHNLIKNHKIFSLIFYGPSGTGKTTLAMVIANELNKPYRLFNAVKGSKKDLDAIFFETKLVDQLILIVDEVHRLNKDKQDLLLPYIEDGSIVLIGATTSNPYFSINPAIRSRVQLVEVQPLNIENIIEGINIALLHKKGLHNQYKFDQDAIELIAAHSNGDLRFAYNLLELLQYATSDSHITKEIVYQYSKVANQNSYKGDDAHYDAVSALQKSIRGSDVNASLYYLSKLALANDMASIERRLLVIAYEDIGLANPAAVARTINAIDAAKRIGFPEALIPLGEQVIDLALSPKSKSAELAIQAAYQKASQTSYSTPKYLRLTPVGLDEEEKYDYSRNDLWHKIQYLPDELKNDEYYKPNTNSSYEKQLSNNYQELKKVTRSNNLKKLKTSK
jgi:putative ATPase